MAVAARITVPPGDRTQLSLPNSYDYGSQLLVRNTGSSEVELGGPEVEVGDGFRLVPEAGVGVDLSESEELYAISSGGTTLDILRTK